MSVVQSFDVMELSLAKASRFVTIKCNKSVFKIEL